MIKDIEKEHLSWKFLLFFKGVWEIENRANEISPWEVCVITRSKRGGSWREGDKEKGSGKGRGTNGREHNYNQKIVTVTITITTRT